MPRNSRSTAASKRKPAKRQHEELDKSEPEDTVDATPAPEQAVAPPPAKRRRLPKKSPAKVSVPSNSGAADLSEEDTEQGNAAQTVPTAANGSARVTTPKAKAKPAAAAAKPAAAAAKPAAAAAKPAAAAAKSIASPTNPSTMAASTDKPSTTKTKASSNSTPAPKNGSDAKPTPAKPPAKRSGQSKAGSKSSPAKPASSRKAEDEPMDITTTPPKPENKSAVTAKAKRPRPQPKKTHSPPPSSSSASSSEYESDEDEELSSPVAPPKARKPAASRSRAKEPAAVKPTVKVDSPKITSPPAKSSPAKGQKNGAAGPPRRPMMSLPSKSKVVSKVTGSVLSSPLKSMNVTGKSNPVGKVPGKPQPVSATSTMPVSSAITRPPAEVVATVRAPIAAVEGAAANSVLYPCGVCKNEVRDEDEATLCEIGCEKWFHRQCTGMSVLAYNLLTAEADAEWVCDFCIQMKRIPWSRPRDS